MCMSCFQYNQGICLCVNMMKRMYMTQQRVAWLLDINPLWPRVTMYGLRSYQHQTINWSNTDLPTAKPSGIYHKEFSMKISDMNSLWPSDDTWQQRSGSTLVQVMACCLEAPSHYLNKYWLIISEVQWQQFHQRYLSHQSLKLHWKFLI